MYTCYWKMTVIVWALVTAGCAETRVSPRSDVYTHVNPIERESEQLRVTLFGVLGEGHEGTLVEDAGWREFLLKFENRDTRSLTVSNVKLLNLNGRYLNSASSYGEITAPPNVGAELAGDLATRTASIVAGQFIPYAGLLTSAISSAASASSAEARESKKREFALRAMKNVELAPRGRTTGSAFLPSITNARALVVDYTHGDGNGRIEIPLPTPTP